MKILIVYATKYGCSEKCAKLLSEKVLGDIELVNINERKINNLDGYDKIIIGGSIYVGVLQNKITDFCSDNIQTLLTKKIGLFVCSMFGGVRGEENMKKVFPENLQKIAISMQLFGGELNKNKMKFVDKFIANMVDKIPLKPGEIVNKGIIIENINKLAEDINNS